MKRPQHNVRNPTTGTTTGTTMTKHHFEMIARVINGLNLPVLHATDIRLHIAYDFARTLEDTNAHFDRKKFIDACTRNDREKLTKRASTGGEIKDFHPDDTLPDLF